MTRILAETGPEGLTKFTTEVFNLASNLDSQFWYCRNIQANVVKGRVVRLPKQEVGKPDYTVLYKGKFIGVELKCGKRKMTEGQKEHRERILNSGGDYHEVRSPGELIGLLRNYGFTRISLKNNKVVTNA